MVTIKFNKTPSEKGQDWALYKGKETSEKPELVLYKAKVSDGYHVYTHLSADYREIKSWIKKMRKH